MSVPPKKIRCPEHPDWDVVALIEQKLSEQVTIELHEDGSVTVDPISTRRGERFVDMTTSVTTGYKCSNPSCGWSFPASRLIEVVRQQEAS